MHLVSLMESNKLESGVTLARDDARPAGLHHIIINISKSGYYLAFVNILLVNVKHLGWHACILRW